MYPQPYYPAPAPYATPSGYDPAPTQWAGMHDKNAGSWGDGWQGFAGEPEPAYGNAAGGASNALAGLGYVLGNLGAGVAGGALSDPRMQAAVTEIQTQCKVQAKQGVTEWMKEHWPVLAFGAIALLIGNYVTLSAALMQAGVRRRSFRKLFAAS